MLRFDANRAVTFCDGLTRRDFLHAGAISSLGLTLPGYLAAREAGAAKDNDVNCIMLFLVGGPSQIDTFDPKPVLEKYHGQDPYKVLPKVEPTQFANVGTPTAICIAWVATRPGTMNAR